MKATRADVAKLAGVSTATVSNVLNNSHRVKDHTVNLVIDAIQRLDYRPDMIARSLSTKRTQQIGIILENIRNPNYGEIVEHFESAANTRGYIVNICIGTQDIDNYFDNFISRRIDGIFIAALPYLFDINKMYRLLDYNIKIVLSGNAEADFKRV